MNNGFHEVRLPVDISYGVTGGPEYITDITVSASELEQRNLTRPEGRCKYTISFDTKRPKQYNALLNFFRARRGKTYGFRFKDWFDYRAVNQLLGEGDGETKTFQLVKSYNDIINVELRKIMKPVKNMVRVYVDGILSNAWECDYTKGLITFDTAPAVGARITADFEFDVPVRFDVAQMSASYDDFNNISYSSIPIVELIGE